MQIDCVLKPKYKMCKDKGGSVKRLYKEKLKNTWLSCDLTATQNWSLKELLAFILFPV